MSLVQSSIARPAGASAAPRVPAPRVSASAIVAGLVAIVVIVAFVMAPAATTTLALLVLPFVGLGALVTFAAGQFGEDEDLAIGSGLQVLDRVL